MYLLSSSSFSYELRITALLRHRNALQAAMENLITSHPPLHLPCHNLRHPNFSEPNPTLSLIICQHSTDPAYTSDVAFRIIALNNQNFYCAGHRAKNLTWSSNQASSSLAWSRQGTWSHSVRLFLFLLRFLSASKEENENERYWLTV